MSLNTVSQDDLYEKFKADKKWFMKGEVTASDTVDKITKQTPLDDNVEITNRHVGLADDSGYTKEEILDKVKELLKANIFFSSVRQVKATDTAKKEIEISGEKSKISLADEYLNMFKRDEECLRMRGDAHDEIRRDMQTLFDDLDTLFHMNYIPIKPATEAKVLFSAPSEGIATVGVSGIAVISPDKKVRETKISQMRGTTERTKLDRKRKKQIIGEQLEKKKTKMNK